MSRVMDRTSVRTLSIIVPVYNEQATVLAVLNKLQELHVPIPAEVIVVDDGSTDGTRNSLYSLEGRSTRYPVRVYFHSANRGKGAAVRTGMDHARGDILVIQDADLELNPRDILRLLEMMLDNDLDVCYGSRFLDPDRSLYLLPAYWANRILNLLSNLVNRIWITDFNTCYKMMSTRVARRLNLQSRGFAMEPEITTKLARMGFPIRERAIRYEPRTSEEGKKIRARDVLSYLWAMLYFRFAPLGETDAEVRSATPSLQPAVCTAPIASGGSLIEEELREAWDALWQPVSERAENETEAPVPI